MKRFDLYGSCSLGIPDVVRVLESSLLAKFVEHESGYRGGVYFRFVADDEELLIQANVEDSEGYLLEPDFAPWSTLVYINGSDRWVTLERTLDEAGLDRL